MGVRYPFVETPVPVTITFLSMVLSDPDDGLGWTWNSPIEYDWSRLRVPDATVWGRHFDGGVKGIYGLDKHESN